MAKCYKVVYWKYMDHLHGGINVMHKECIRSPHREEEIQADLDAKHPLVLISGVILMVKQTLNGSLGTTRCPRSANAELILIASLQRKARKAGWVEEHVYSSHPTSGQERHPFHLPFVVLCCPLTRVIPNFFLGMKRAFWECCIPALPEAVAGGTR